MKDIFVVLEILKKNNISQSSYAKGIEATRQNIHTWKTCKWGIPKQYLKPTIRFINENTEENLTTDDLLDCLEE